MQRVLILVFLFFLFLTACSNESPTESETALGKILADTMEIKIVRDETPGFKYPMIRHDINFVGHLDKPGFIDEYSYESQGVGFNLIIEYVQGYNPKAGTKFKLKETMWSKDLIAVGSSLNYTFSANSPFGKSYVKNTSTKVLAYNSGISPVSTSKQLTGPENRNSRPLFSKDGSWIYYRGWDAKLSINSVNRIPVNGGNPETIFETTESIGGFTLTDGDSVITYIEQKRNSHSQLVKYHIRTDTKEIFPVKGFIWDSELLHIPGTNKFVCMTDPNHVTSNLVLIDSENGSVEDLIIQAQEGLIIQYDYRPGTSEISVVINTADTQKEVVLLNINNREKNIFIQNFSGSEFVWAPNGEDYAISKSVNIQGRTVQNIYYNLSGAEQQLTFYPGEEEDISFSQDGKFISYSANRRGETQIWQLTL